MTVSEAICPRHHVPRSQCDPRKRHTQSFRCGDGLWEVMTALGNAPRTDRNWEMEQALQEWAALPDDKETFTTAVIANEGIHQNPRTVRCSDELWGRVADKARRLGLKPADGVRAALRRRAVLGGAALDGEPDPVRLRRDVTSPAGKAEGLPADAASSLRAELEDLRSEVSELRKLTVASGEGDGPAAEEQPPAARTKPPAASRKPSRSTKRPAPVVFADGTGQQAAW